MGAVVGSIAESRERSVVELEDDDVAEEQVSVDEVVEVMAMVVPVQIGYCTWWMTAGYGGGREGGGR